MHPSSSSLDSPEIGDTAKQIETEVSTRDSYLDKEESQVLVNFFKANNCYALMPVNAKLVILSTDFLVEEAFQALVKNHVRAAPLWDSEKMMFAGMLTITDFIKILEVHYDNKKVMEKFEEQNLNTWRKILKEPDRPLISINAEAPLFDAIQTLISNKIHRLPVTDPKTGCVLYILSHRCILNFLVLNISELPKLSFPNKTIEELRIGTFENLETATKETSVITVLKKFVKRRVSALPVVDQHGKLVDIYSKFDVIDLAAKKIYKNFDYLHLTLEQVSEHKNEWFEGVSVCKLSETLFQVTEKIIRARVHRVVVEDDQDKVIGIISLSDILYYLVLTHCSIPENGNQENTNALDAETRAETSV